MLHAPSTPRQPGGRNWLWQTVEVKGLEEALQRARMADFLNALGAPNRRLAVVALPAGRRTVLDLTPAGELPGAAPTRPVSELFSSIVSDITGKVVTTAVQANLRSAERQQELDKRLMAGVSSYLQIAYLVLAVLGLIGVPVSRAWWSRIWPPEVPTEYAGRTGYWAARAVRALAFWVVFLPLTAVVAAPHNLATQILGSGDGACALLAPPDGSPSTCWPAAPEAARYRPAGGNVAHHPQQQRSRLARSRTARPAPALPQQVDRQVAKAVQRLAAKLSLSFVIPAPLASKARERDQAGTHAAHCLLSAAIVHDGAASSPWRLADWPSRMR